MADAPRGVPLPDAWASLHVPQPAAAIVDEHPDLDGMLVESTHDGPLTTVLLPPAEDSFPASPRGAEPLNAPVILTGIVDATEQINYDPTRRDLVGCRLPGLAREATGTVGPLGLARLWSAAVLVRVTPALLAAVHAPLPWPGPFPRGADEPLAGRRRSTAVQTHIHDRVRQAVSAPHPPP